MSLHVYPDVYASGSVPAGWLPSKGGAIKYPVRNAAVLTHLRQLLPGKWQKVITQTVNETRIIAAPSPWSMSQDKWRGSSSSQAQRTMNRPIGLKSWLDALSGSRSERLALFAFVNLGLVESLASGRMSASDALKIAYHADNCLYVRRELRDKTADEVMSRGVQLADLFDTLPAKEARRELQRELAAMRSLCLKLLEKKKLVA
jgi:hypothetical protein